MKEIWTGRVESGRREVRRGRPDRGRLLQRVPRLCDDERRRDRDGRARGGRSRGGVARAPVHAHGLRSLAVSPDGAVSRRRRAEATGVRPHARAHPWVVASGAAPRGSAFRPRPTRTRRAPVPLACSAARSAALSGSVDRRRSCPFLSVHDDVGDARGSRPREHVRHARRSSASRLERQAGRRSASACGSSFASSSSRHGGPPPSGTPSVADWRIDCGESTLSAAVGSITGADGVVGRPAGGV